MVLISDMLMVFVEKAGLNGRVKDLILESLVGEQVSGAIELVPAAALVFALIPNIGVVVWCIRRMDHQ